MTPSTETRLSIILKLPKDIADLILATKEKTGVYYPNHVTSIPHITLYACAFDEQQYPELVRQLAAIQIAPFEVTIGELSFTKHDKNNNTFVSFGFKNKGTLQELHEQVLAIANPLRGNLIRFKDAERSKKGIFSEEEFATIERYGYQYVNEHFNSHVTIGEVDEKDSGILETLKDALREIEGRTFLVDRFYAKHARTSLPDETKLFESEMTEILLKKILPTV